MSATDSADPYGMGAGFRTRYMPPRLAGAIVEWTETRSGPAAEGGARVHTSHSGQVLQASWDASRGSFMLLVLDADGEHLHAVDAVRSGARVIAVGTDRA